MPQGYSIPTLLLRVIISLNFKETLGISMLTSEYIEDRISKIGSYYDLEKDVIRDC